MARFDLTFSGFHDHLYPAPSSGNAKGDPMRVMIALDDSEQARAVLDTLSPLLRRTDAEVHLLSIIDLSEVQATMRARQPGPEPVATLGGSRPPVQPPFPRAQESHGQALTRARVEREEWLLRLVESALSGIRTQIHVVSDKDTASAIARFGVEIGADLIAVGTHGRSGLTRALMGSVAEAVVRRSERPVILVRSGMHTTEPDGPTG